MSTPTTVKQRPSSTRHSRITVEYHRPSRESIQEYGALLDQANLHASSNSLPSFTPSRQAPPPPPSGPSSFKAKDPLSPTTATPVHKTRNSLQKPPPRNRKPSIQTNTLRANRTMDSSLPNNTDLSPIKSSYSQSNGSSPNVTSPPRPSRANTTTLNDIFPTQSTMAQRRISTPVIGSIGFHDHARHGEEEEVHSSHPLLNPIGDSPPVPQLPSSFTTNGTGTTRARSATVTKGKKGMLGFVSDLLGSNKRVEISTPYDPVHLTHVGFNTSTGEFTGLPKEWQQLLQESGISRMEQERNPEAVMEIVKFYQEGGGGGDVWDKMGGALKGGPPVLPAPPASKPLMDESFYAPVCLSNPPISAFNAEV
jgi:p21-activated kinase 1